MSRSKKPANTYELRSGWKAEANSPQYDEAYVTEQFPKLYNATFTAGLNAADCQQEHNVGTFEAVVYLLAFNEAPQRVWSHEVRIG